MQPQDVLVGRIRGEFREMPGLILTTPQACRLWNLDRTACEAVLQALLDEGFLAQTAAGQCVAYASEHVRPVRTVVSGAMIDDASSALIGPTSQT
jgi:hypothetical protein